MLYLCGVISCSISFQILTVHCVPKKIFKEKKDLGLPPKSFISLIIYAQDSVLWQAALDLSIMCFILFFFFSPQIDNSISMM